MRREHLALVIGLAVMAPSVRAQGPPTCTASGSIDKGLAFKDSHGRGVLLSAYGTARLVVSFVASWGIPNRSQLDALNDARAAIKPSGGSIVAVVVSPSEIADLTNLGEKRGVLVPLIAAFDDKAVFSAYGMKALPSTIFVGRSGVIDRCVSGALSAEAIREYFDKR